MAGMSYLCATRMHPLISGALSWCAAFVPFSLEEIVRSVHEYWQGKRVKVVDKVQRWMMDLLLKSNNVSEGARDYFGVIGMIMTMDALSPTSSSPACP